MRNNSGAMKNEEGRVVRFGLGNESVKRSEHIKSSDLIGIWPVTITPQMVGSTVGLFVAVEVKSPDWNPAKKLDARETAQKNFIDWIRSLGGIAGFANNVDGLLKILRG